MRWPGSKQPHRDALDELMGIVPIDESDGIDPAPGDEPGRVPPVTDLPLLVPAAEEHAARARGALWDPAIRRLVVPAGSNLPVHRFKRWLDPAGPAVDEGEVVDANPLALARRCYRCGARTTVLVGALVDEPDWTLDPEGFVPFDAVAEVLAGAIDKGLLARIGAGPLRWRRSRQVPHGYVSNGCVGCDAIQGSFFLGEDFTEYLAGGGTYAGLRTGLSVAIPTAVLAWAMGE